MPNLLVGQHTLDVVFHKGRGGYGEILQRDTLTFTVTDTSTDAPFNPPSIPDDPTLIPPDLPTGPTDPVDASVGDNGPAPGSLAAWADQVVLHFDGNNNDEDDIAAIPVAALLAASAGIADRTTFLYGNNVSETTNNA